MSKTRKSAFTACGGRGPTCRAAWSDVTDEPVFCLDWLKLNAGVYCDAPGPGDKRMGWRLLVKHFRYVRNYCNGMFRVVFMDERDGQRSWDPRPLLMMRLETLDETTGAFVARVVPRAMPLAPRSRLPVPADEHFGHIRHSTPGP